MSTIISGVGFNAPLGIARDSSGNIYVADTNNHCIRKITSAGVLTTFAGSCGTGTYGFINGTGTSARFNKPSGLAMRGTGSLYVADSGNHVIRLISLSSASVSTVAGTGFIGFSDGLAQAAYLNNPTGVAYNPSNGFLYIADSGNSAIRYFTGTSIVTLAGGGTPSSPSNFGYMNGVGVNAKFNSPSNLTIVGGNLYITDSGNNCIRKVEISTATVTTFAGSTTYGYLDGIGTAAKFGRFVQGITSDTSGNLYVTDPNNKRVRKIVIATGSVTTIAGNGTSTITDGLALSNGMSPADDITFGLDGNLYVLETSGSRVRKIYSSC
jgi:sugar lactone lactonase YvrE